MNVADPVENETIWISIAALLMFIVGYLLPASRPSSFVSEKVLNSCADFSYRVTILLAVPALAIAVYIFAAHSSPSGRGLPMPYAFQAVLYLHLFFGFMSIGSTNPSKNGWRPTLVATTLLVLPRLLISLHGGRFFLAQAAVPVLLIAIARGWIRPNLKRVLQLIAVALFIIFVPAITRGDQVIGPGNEVAIFTGSNILGLFQDNRDMSLDDNCPPLLISLTAKSIPWGAMKVCVVDIGGLTDMPATLERILTNNEQGTFHGTAAGTGSNYLLELYVSGGLFAVYLGSIVFGFSCRRFISWAGSRSLFCGIWAECLTRALLTPRGNIGYVYERIPSLVLATLLVMAIVWAWSLLKNSSKPLPAQVGSSHFGCVASAAPARIQAPNMR